MSFVQRKIDVTFSLGEGSFGDSGFNTLKVTGLRVHAKIKRMGLPGASTAEISVFGLPLSDMNQLSTLGNPNIFLRNNRILVEAGDAVSGMSTAYAGTIWTAWADMSGMPQTKLEVSAIVGSLAALTPVKPASYPGSADAANVISAIASTAGFGFENSGVSGVMLSSPYLDGTARDQFHAAITAANIYGFIDDSVVPPKMCIWPRSGSRNGAIPLISPTTGLVGYPRYSDRGIGCRSIYNPSIAFGGNVQVQSSITPACGTWTVNALDHSLQSETPGGDWFTDFEGYRLGNPATLPA